MKFLICLFAVVAVANAGFLAGNNLYGSGLYGSGSYISRPVSYINSAPSVQVVRTSSPIYHSAQVYHSSPIVSSQIVSSPIVSAPIYRSSPIISSYSAPISHSIGLSYGPRYSNYGIGGGISVLNGGLLKRQ